MDQGAIERTHVCQHFLLHDNRSLIGMDELDRVFDGDNLAAALVVDQVHHVIQRRRFACPRGACHQHQAVWTPRQLIKFFRQAQFFAGRNAVPAKSAAHFRVTVTAVEGRSHPANRRVYQRNTQLPFLIEFFPLLLV